MTVVHEGVRRVDDDVARGQDAREHVEVLAAARRGAGAQRRVKGADLHEDVATHGHAHACAHAGRRDREQRSTVTLLAQDLEALGDIADAPDARGHVLGEAAARLEPALGRVALLQGQRNARRGGHVRRGRERVDHGGEPVRVDDRVVVRKDDDLAASSEHAAVAGAGQARTGRRDDAQARIVDARELLSGQAGVRRVIDDNERETLVILREDGAHGFLKHVAGADRAHDNGRVHLGTGALFPAARRGRLDLEHARIGLRMVRALDLDERRVAAVIAHEHERSRIRRVARNQLGDARSTVNVPDGGGQLIGHGGLLGAHFLPFFEEALAFDFLELDVSSVSFDGLDSATSEDVSSAVSSSASGSMTSAD